MYFELETLEFNKILDKIVAYANLDRTVSYIKDIKPINDLDLINELLDETDEMRNFIVKFGNLPFGDRKDVFSFINLAKKGGTLSISEIYLINELIKTSKNIKKTKTNLQNQFSFVKLTKYIDTLVELNDLNKEIDRCILPDLTISDNASIDLVRIRRGIKLLEVKLKNKLQELISSKKEMLVESNITIRNDRFCLPVKQEYKNIFKGIIHDQSATGQTIYIEPQATYEINNELISEQNKEKEEIQKILIMLSSNISSYADELLYNLDMITKLDMISSKANYSINFNKPELNKDGYLELNNAIHPLLDKEKAVPLNISLGKKYKTIIITGPNTGGKTVSLKTVGLLTLMAQSGILIPVKTAKIAVFDNIFSDIGDEQSIEQSLSTFSSHMKKIVNITENINDNSLVLLDELGGGTDPIEGSALAISLLNYFMDKNARIIITTHYPSLKEYGYENDQIMNASMEFNEETYMPTYRLLLGISGKSNAFLISKHLGLDEEIINNANKYLYEDNSDSLLMKKVEEKGLYLNKLIEENEQIRKDILNEKIKYANEIKELELKQESIIKRAKDDANKIYLEAKEKASDLMKEVEGLLNENTQLNDVAVVKHKINSLKTEKEVNLNLKELKVGDTVTIIPYECNGEILSINKDKYRVKFGNLEKDFKITDLKYAYTELKKETKPKKYTDKVFKSVSTKLDLRGYRYEDAYIALDKYIDDCVCAKIPNCTIVHGFGTGVIRKLVWDYLKTNKFVKSYRYGEQGEGLNGATIVYFK
ncbi:MAG: endonuclease MutS2 [Acholeplasmatales bacterium]|nr:endonuclease MutS2 [Acholeplasmatales bacterium]